MWSMIPKFGARMHVFSVIYITFTSVLVYRTRQVINLDIEVSSFQKNKKFQHKLMPEILCFKSLVLRVGINFLLSYRLFSDRIC